MTGFKNFLLRGNLVELAVALIMALAFASVVTATVALIMDIIGKIGGTPELLQLGPEGHLRRRLDHAVISFVIMAAVVYFVIVKPYTIAKEKYFPSPEPGTPEDVKLLTEIRDLLAQRSGTAPTV